MISCQHALSSTSSSHWSLNGPGGPIRQRTGREAFPKHQKCDESSESTETGSVRPISVDRVISSLLLFRLSRLKRRQIISRGRFCCCCRRCNKAKTPDHDQFHFTLTTCYRPSGFLVFEGGGAVVGVLLNVWWGVRRLFSWKKFPPFGLSFRSTEIWSRPMPAHFPGFFPLSLLPPWKKAFFGGGGRGVCRI